MRWKLFFILFFWERRLSSAKAGDPRRDAYGNNNVQVVAIKKPFAFAWPLLTNCQVFLDSCLRVQFALPENVLNVKAYVLFGGTIKLCN